MRFRLQVSLRVFLGFCVLVAFSLGVFHIWVLQPLMRRADAESRLRATGATIIKGKVTYYPEDPRFPTRQNVVGVPLERTGAERLLSMTMRREIDFRAITEIQFLSAQRPATDKDLDDVACFPELEKLDLTMIVVTLIPGGMKCQNIGAPDVSDRGLAKVAHLPRLRKLHMGDCRLGDIAMRELAKSPSIELLGFAQSKVTDEGLLYLAEIPTLREIAFANNPAITSEGDGRFRRARPDLKIWSNYTSNYPQSAQPDFAQW